MIGTLRGGVTGENAIQHEGLRSGESLNIQLGRAHKAPEFLARESKLKLRSDAEAK